MNLCEFQDIEVDVFKELMKAYVKHGEDNENRSDLFISCTILTEEIGEVAKAIVDECFNEGSLDDIKVELLQSAAMAIEMVHEVNKKLIKKASKK